MHEKRWDVGVLALAGLGLWGLAAVFLWRDLEVPLEAFLGRHPGGRSIDCSIDLCDAPQRSLEVLREDLPGEGEASLARRGP
jgi:hypothetical protein